MGHRGRQCSRSSDGTASSREVAKAIDWGPGYANSRELQSAFRQAVDFLINEGWVQLGPGKGNARYEQLTLVGEADQAIHAIEQACLKRDIAVLADFLGFGKANRLLTVEVLLKAIQEADVPEGMDAEHYVKILRAKVYQEFVLGLEELGALCHAIRRRFDHGILYQYLNYRPESISAFFGLALNSPGQPLDRLLTLPLRDDIRAKIPKADAEQMIRLFDEFGHWLRTAAGTYLEQAIVTAMNKVKHGFVVVDDASVLAQLNLPAEDELAVLLANRWEPLGDWDAHWTFEYTPLKKSFDVMLKELLKRMYFFQGWLITTVQQLHAAGVDLTCYRPGGSAEDLTGAYPAARQL